MSEQENGVFVKHIPCPECGSIDNLGLYLKETEDGDHYDASCFGCKAFFSHNQLVENGMLDANFEVDKSVLKAPKQRITREEYNDLVTRTNLCGKMSDGNQYRGLDDWVLGFYGHRVERFDDGRIRAVYYPETKEGKLMGYKSRHLPKKFGIGNVGKTGISNDLSGQHKFPNGGRDVVIVAGEEDKCAAQQMFREYQIMKKQDAYDHYAVVSPTTGEGSAAKQIAANYDFFDNFENVYVCMDNDDAGRDAAEAIIKVLPKDKVKVMNLSGKDCNEMLLQGRQKQFISNFFDAKPVIETGIYSSIDSMQGVYDFLTSEKIKFPPMLEKLNEAARGGIRSTGAIVNIIADTSTGKTLFSDGLAIWWAFNSPLVPTTLSIERTKEEYMVDIISQHLGKNLSWFKNGFDAIDYLNNPDVKLLIDDLVVNEYGEPRFHVIDERNGGVEALKKQVDRSWKQYGSRLFILDPLSDVLRSLGNDAQEEFMMWEKQMKKEGLVLVNILHTRKPMPDKEGKIRPVTEYDALGSSSFVQSADINIVLNRDKMAVDSVIRNTTKVEVPKLRGGTTGHICDLYYDPNTRRQYDKEVYFENFYKQQSVDEPVQPNCITECTPSHDHVEETVF